MSFFFFKLLFLQLSECFLVIFTSQHYHDQPIFCFSSKHLFGCITFFSCSQQPFARNLPSTFEEALLHLPPFPPPSSPCCKVPVHHHCSLTCSTPYCHYLCLSLHDLNSQASSHLLPLCVSISVSCQV